MRQLTDGEGADEMPAISADGRRVAFVRTLHDDTPSGRKPELYTVSTAGGEAVRLTENTVEDVNPVFSPDGKKLMWTSTRGRDGTSQLWIADWLRAAASAKAP